MPTNYTGNPSAIQAPDAGPDTTPGSAVIVSLPNAGEGASVASISQALKALADYVSHARKVLRMKVASALTSLPQLGLLRAGAADTDYTFCFDHNGFPTGNSLVVVRENWQAVNVTVTSTGIIANYGHLKTTITAPGSTTIAQGCLQLFTGGGAGAAEIYLNQGVDVTAMPDRPWVMEWMGGGFSGVDSWEMGLRDQPTGAGKIVFSYTSAAPNVQAKCVGAGTTTVDTGWAASNATTRYRIEYQPASSPYGACVMFYIHGVLRATITTNIYTNGSGGYMTPYFKVTGVSGAGSTMTIYPLVYCYRSYYPGGTVL